MSTSSQRSTRNKPAKRISPAVLAAIIAGAFALLAACIGAIATIVGSAWVLIQPQEAPIIVQPTLPQVDVVPTLEPTRDTFATSPPAPTTIPESRPTSTSEPAIPTALSATQPPLAISKPLPFRDTFDSGLSSDWEVQSGTWRVVNGQLTADPGHDWSVILVGDSGWSDYVLEVDAYNYSWSYPIRIIVRERNGNYLALQTNCCETDWIAVSGTSENVIAHLDKGGLSFSRSEGFVRNHFRIEVVGQMYSAYIDGSLYLQVQDQTLSNGRVGLALSYPFENTVRFDDFGVTAQ